ncbi:MAG: lytic transglycosylase domain-containing protein [Acidobacteriota bacterium]
MGTPRVRRMRAVIAVALFGAREASPSPDPGLTRALLDEDPVAARAAWDALAPATRQGLQPFGGELAAGRLLVMEEKPAEAIAVYRAVAKDEAWRDVAFREMAGAARQAGDRAAELEALQGLLTVANDHPDIEAMKLRLAVLLAAKGETERARTALSALETSTSRRTRRDAGAQLLLLLLVDVPSYPQAVSRFEALLAEDDADDAALVAARAMVAFEAKNAVALSPDALRARGLCFYKNRQWGSAIRLLAQAADLPRATPEGYAPEAAAERGKKKNKRKARPAPKRSAAAKAAGLDRAETVFSIARIYFREGDYRSAAAAFETAAGLSSSSSFSASAAFQRAVCLERLGSTDAAMEILASLGESSPGEMARHALSRRVGILRSLGRLDEARTLLAQARGAAKDPAYRAELSWTEARIEMAANPERALAILDGFVRLVGEDGNRARLMREELLDPKAAAERAELLSRVMREDPSGFFGEVARERIAPLPLAPLMADPKLVIAADESSPAVLLRAKDRLLDLWSANPGAFQQAGLGVLSGLYEKLPRYRNVSGFDRIDLRAVTESSPRYLRLLASGLAREACFAMMEDGDSRSLGPMTRASVYTLGGEWNRALALAQARAGALPRDVLPEAYPAALRRLLYPLPREIVRGAKDAGIPFALAAAIAREESAYEPDARSPAGAYGLMQVVPDTAKAIAAEVAARGMANAPDPEGDNLYDVKTAVFFGTRYLAHLWDRFDASPAPVIAAYNAGPDAASDWVRRSGRGLVPFEGEIAFAETKQYLRRVYLSYLRYREIYPAEGGADPAPAWPDLLELPRPI